MKEAAWKCLKILVVVFIFLSSLLAVYVRWKGRDFDPIREIQNLRNHDQRDDALDVVKFLKENHLGDQEKIAGLEKDLHYRFSEIIESLFWNGIIQGKVLDTYSGIGALSADITMFGDVRDLAIQTFKRIRGDPDTDNWVLGLSAAGVTFSTAPFLNESYALAKSLAKYSERLPGICLNPVLKQFLSGKLSADDVRKIWNLFEEAGKSIPRTASFLCKISRSEDIETVLDLIKVHRKTGSAFIILAGEKGVDLFKVTPRSLKEGFIEVFRKNPKAVMGLTKAQLVIHSIKVLHKYQLVALIIPFLVASLILNLLPGYLVWTFFVGSTAYLVHLLTKKSQKKGGHDVKPDSIDRKPWRRPGGVLFVRGQPRGIFQHRFPFVKEKDRLDQGGLFRKTCGGEREIPSQGGQDWSHWNPGSAEMGDRGRSPQVEFRAYRQLTRVYQDRWERF